MVKKMIFCDKKAHINLKPTISLSFSNLNSPIIS